MKIRRDFNLGIASIILLNIFSVLVMIALFSRLEINQKSHIDTQNEQQKNYAQNMATRELRSSDALSPEIQQTWQDFNQKIFRDDQTFYSQQSQIIQASQWVLAAFAIVSLLIGILIWRSLNYRLLVPIEEVFTVLKSVKAGNLYRRCSLSQKNSELRDVYESVNEILDEKQRDEALH